MLPKRRVPKVRRRRSLSDSRLAELAKKLSHAGVVFAAESEVERKLLNTSSAVVIKFWDGKMHLAEEAFAEVAKKFGDEIKFVCVRTKSRSLKKKYDLKVSPTYIFFEDGKEKSRIEGPSPSEALEVWCEIHSS